jgi:hypothetical protein
VERWRRTGTLQYVLHWQGKGMKIKQGVLQWSTHVFQVCYFLTLCISLALMLICFKFRHSAKLGVQSEKLFFLVLD